MLINYLLVLFFILGEKFVSNKQTNKPSLPTTMDSNDVCTFCMEPIVTKTRSTTHFTYRCGHMFHTKCVAAYVVGSNADIKSKFRCINCRGFQSVWHPTRVSFAMARQSRKDDEALYWREEATTRFLECAYIESFRPGRVGFGSNLEIVKIPATFDITKCKKNVRIAVLFLIGKSKFTNRAHFDQVVQSVTNGVEQYIEDRVNHKTSTRQLLRTIRDILFMK